MDIAAPPESWLGTPSEWAVTQWLGKAGVRFSRVAPEFILLPEQSILLRIVQKLNRLEWRPGLVRLREHDLAIALDQAMTLALRGEEMPYGS